jgi:tripeptide aminopeptidase
MSAIAALTADVHRSLAGARDALAAADDAILRQQIAIAGVRAPTFAEAARGALVADALERAGWSARVDEVGNVVARMRPSTRPAVAVCAHLDTVYATDDTPIPVRDGNRISAPGICDNGRGLAALLALAAPLRALDPALPVELVATTGEEGAGDLRGARHHVATARPSAVIAIDGAGDERIVNTALGSRRFHIRYRGPGGHSWSAYGVANAVHAAARCASRVATLTLPRGATVTVARIGGGTSVNAIPDDAWLEIDARATADDTLAAIEADVRALAESAAREENARRASGEALRHEVRRIGMRACGQTPATSAIVEAAVAATRLVGRRPELCVASTDANAAVAAGIPAIAIGAGGRGGDVHSAREWFDATDGARGLARALTLVATVARAAAGARA